MIKRNRKDKIPKPSNPDISPEEQLWTERAEKLRALFITGAGELLERAELETRFLIQDILPEAGVGLLVGKPGDGKSWLAYDLALAVARARPWLFYRNGARKKDGSPQPRRVLVLNYDNPEAELARRFLRMGMTPADPLFFHSLARETAAEGLPAILRLPAERELLFPIIESIRPGLILIDSLRQAHTFDEAHSKDMGVLCATLRQMTQWGAAVLAIHHLRKKSGDRDKQRSPEDFDLDAEIRGSGELVASADVTLHVGMTRRETNAVHGVLRVAKTRGWNSRIAICDYKFRDVGDTTLVEPGGRFDVVLGVIEKHGPIKRRDIQRKVAGLTADKLTQLIDLAIEKDLVREVQPAGGGSRALVLAGLEKSPARLSVEEIRKKRNNHRPPAV